MPTANTILSASSIEAYSHKLLYSLKSKNVSKFTTTAAPSTK